ncbi:uncharacterized protein N7443_010602 [Penicillium atrosanguineum]|uniref:uncharacterized protein n=1 Tax=Penicillium atrosanguineum TaxID=1132637 RepID=UPI0023A367F5|nr:uncharacterized protein N7443_010602 [Penicillium atrosanguineum]KAJ5141431.1 hypothetical protein N7526_002426 [Penicillium atrosanguineum]KAJ5290349.1 hypothetical protein N7443_010602 [Penicillium atrosanguineum]
MDPYDSDSSVDEDFTETGVLLGYAAEEVVEDTISHLGGWPKWLDDKTPPPGDYANCKVCNSPMILLLELHGDLPDHFPTDERRLYIFGCPRKPCNRKPGSVRAYRSIRKVTWESIQEQCKPVKEEKKVEPKPSAPPKPRTDLGASLFGATSLTSSVSASANPFSNPFSSNQGSAASAANPFATPKPATTTPVPAPAPSTPSINVLAESFADKVRLSSPGPTNPSAATKPKPESQAQTPWPAQSEFPAPYTNFFLDAEYETMSRPSTPKIPDNVTMEPMDEEGQSSGTAELKDTFESELDRAFMKFSMRLEHNPEQVLRYEYRGTPLLYNYADQVGKRLHTEHSAGHVTTTGGGNLPPCDYCGSPRVFEMQLAPHAISVLEEGRPGVGLGEGDAGMEWGTIILGVCSKDCGPETIGQVGWREEWAGVQWEDLK